MGWGVLQRVGVLQGVGKGITRGGGIPKEY